MYHSSSISDPNTYNTIEEEALAELNALLNTQDAKYESIVFCVPFCTSSNTNKSGGDNFSSDSMFLNVVNFFLSPP